MLIYSCNIFGESILQYNKHKQMLVQKNEAYLLIYKQFKFTRHEIRQEHENDVTKNETEQSHFIFLYPNYIQTSIV